jgi:hypothetical protein
MNRYPYETRNVVNGQEDLAKLPVEVSREGKRMYGSYKNKQTFKFGDLEPAEINPYVQPARKFVPEYQGVQEDDQEYRMYQGVPVGLKENIPKGLSDDPKKAYAQELLNQINLKNQKKVADQYEKDQILALRQWELQQYREEEDRKKAMAKQRTKDYREMLEIQTRIKKTTQMEDKDSRANTEPKSIELRVTKNSRNSAFNPITGEAYEVTEDPRLKNDPYKPNEKSLASYGNLVVQARRPY